MLATTHSQHQHMQSVNQNKGGNSKHEKYMKEKRTFWKKSEWPTTTDTSGPRLSCCIKYAALFFTFKKQKTDMTSDRETETRAHAETQSDVSEVPQLLSP